jgi:hypothetical protein
MSNRIASASRTKQKGVRPCILSILLLAAGLTACSDDPATPKTDEHATAKQRWQQAGVREYDLTQWRDCFCMLGGREVLLRVRANGLSSATLVEEGRDLSAAELQWYCTVDSLFSFVEQARAAAPASLIVEYDALLGYPLRISVDYSTQIADDEITIRSAAFRER